MADKLPPVLMLKRVALRVFPNNVVVGIYYSRDLNKWVSIPNVDIGVSEEINTEIEALIEELSNE